MRWHSSRGYVMLAALLIAAVAAAFALLMLSGVLGMSSVEGSDAAARRALARLREALDAAADRQRWYPEMTDWVLESNGRPREQGSWRAECSPLPAVGENPWPTGRLEAEGRAWSARRRAVATVVLRRVEWAQGVTCPGDLRAGATMVVRGSGLYIGGSVWGRENIAFETLDGSLPAEGVPPDLVHGEAYPEGSVHAVRSIFAEDVEIHEDGAPAYPVDTDCHTGETSLDAILVTPSMAWLATVRRRAIDIAAGFRDGRLDLGALPLAAPGVTAGGCLFVSSDEEEVTVVGSPATGAKPLLLVVSGDAVLGETGTTTVLTGAVVVCGHLAVAGDVRLFGSLYAGSMDVTGRLDVTIDPGWRRECVAGIGRPVITELSL